MPKLKTNRAAAKRFSRTGSGGFKRAQGYHNHILTKKSSKRKRQLAKNTMVHPSDVKGIERLLPHS